MAVLTALATAAVLLIPASAQAPPVPEAVVRARDAEIIFSPPKGVLIAPNLAVTIRHSIEELAPGTEANMGLMALVYRDAERSITGSLTIRPEHTRRARLVCASNLSSTRNGGGYDYAIWEVLEPLPEEAIWLPLSYNLNDIRWVGAGPKAYRARYTGRFVRSGFQPAMEFPQIQVDSGRLQPVDGWSGTPVLTDRGELAGLVALGDPWGHIYPTIPRWWTCHRRR